jgi:hypothetical protein
VEPEWGVSEPARDTIPNEILSAVESWLVDPRGDRQHRSSRIPSEIRLDGEFSTFLTQHGLV